MTDTTRILLIDDEPAVLDAYGTILKRAGYIVSEAETAKQGIARLAEFKPDLVLVDMVLPDMSGKAVLSHIKSSPDHGHVFVIIISGLERSWEDKDSGIDSGADDYITKPVSKQELLFRIRTMVRLKASEKELRRARNALRIELEDQVLKLRHTNSRLAEEIKERKSAQLELARQVEELNAINSISKHITSSLILDEVLSNIYTRLASVIKFDKAVIYLCRENELFFQKTGSREAFPNFNPLSRIRLGECLCGKAAQTGIPVYSGEIGTDDRCTINRCRQEGVRSFAAIPLRTGERILGVLGIGTMKKQDLGALSIFLETIGHQVSLAISNAMVHQRLLEGNQRLEEREAHLNTAHELASIGSFDQNLENGAFYFSKRFFKLFGYEDVPLQMSPDFFRDHIHKEDAERFAKDYKRLLKEVTSVDNEYRIKRRDGVVRQVRLVSKVLPATGSRPVKLIGVFQDITEKKLMERQIIQNEKLASLGFLVSGVAHEINNPNNFITFNIPILKDYLAAIMPIVDEYVDRHPGYTVFNMAYPDFRKDIFTLMDNVAHGSNRINRIVANLREFVHTSGKIDSEMVEVKAVIHKCVEICRGKIGKLVSSFNVSCSETLSNLYIDAEVVEVVLINLLINAAQAGNKQDSFVKLSAAEDPDTENRVIIEITDNGCGMDNRTLNRIFDPFFTTKPPGQGTGIGLSLCHNMIQSIDGRIEVESEKDKGSCFRVIFNGRPAADNGARQGGAHGS